MHLLLLLSCKKTNMAYYESSIYKGLVFVHDFPPKTVFHTHGEIVEALQDKMAKKIAHINIHTWFYARYCASNSYYTTVEIYTANLSKSNLVWIPFAYGHFHKKEDVADKASDEEATEEEDNNNNTVDKKTAENTAYFISAAEANALVDEYRHAAVAAKIESEKAEALVVEYWHRAVAVEIERAAKAGKNSVTIKFSEKPSNEHMQKSTALKISEMLVQKKYKCQMRGVACELEIRW